MNEIRRLRFEIAGYRTYLYISGLSLIENLLTSFFLGSEIHRLRRLLLDVHTYVDTRIGHIANH